MFYSLADCLAKRREHAVVQVPWLESHQTRVHRPCERSKCSTDVREGQGMEPFTPCLQAGGEWLHDGSARFPRSEERTSALPVGEGSRLPLLVWATRSRKGWACRPSPLLQERRASPTHRLKPGACPQRSDTLPIRASAPGDTDDRYLSAFAACDVPVGYAATLSDALHRRSDTVEVGISVPCTNRHRTGCVGVRSSRCSGACARVP